MTNAIVIEPFSICSSFEFEFNFKTQNMSQTQRLHHTGLNFGNSFYECAEKASLKKLDSVWTKFKSRTKP